MPTTKTPFRFRLITSFLLASLLLAFGASAASAVKPRPKQRTARACHRANARRRTCLAVRLISPTPALATNGNARTASKAPEAPSGGLTPQSLHSAYLLPYHGGANQTVGIVDAFDDPAAEADLAVYDHQFHLPACTAVNGCLRKVNQAGQSAPLPKEESGWDGEISLDLQMTHSICPECHILLVEAENEESPAIDAAVNTAASLGATEISNSYGSEEVESAVSEASVYNHPGIAITAAAGDEGEETGFPASAPTVVSVGGTSLEGEEGKWTNTAWEGTGSGCSAFFLPQPWQGTVSDFGTLGCESKRANNDVSAVANPETGVDVYDSISSEESPAGWGVWGGTSVASPIVAAEFALSGGTHGVAYPAETLYRHLGNGNALDDVTSGANAEPCSSPICEAGPSYDGPTGVGSPIGLEAFSVAGAPVRRSAPKLAGRPTVGKTLVANLGSWTGSSTKLSYEWQRNDGEGFEPIPAATGLSHKLTRDDAGSLIRVVVFASNASGVSDAVSPITEVIPRATHVHSLQLSPSRFRVSSGGSLVEYKVSQGGEVTLSIRPLNNGKAKISRASGRFSHVDVRGTNRLYFSGRWHGKALRPGSYELTVQPKLGEPVTTQFSVMG